MNFSIESLRAWAFDFNHLILSVFNKEGIAIFCVFCILIFALASMAALWAFESGEFRDLEAAKFEMMDD